MSDFKVTLRELRAADACESGMEYLRKIVGVDFPDDALIDLADLPVVKDLSYALWALRCVPGHDRDKRLYAVACARRVQHLMEDERSILVLDVAERYANGQATDGELAAAYAYAAVYAARSAVYAASSDAAYAAAYAAADASSAAYAAYAAAAADAAADAYAASSDAYAADAYAAERQWQFDLFIAMCNGRAPWQHQQGE